MNNKLKTRLLIIGLCLLTAIPVSATGCQGEQQPTSALTSAKALSSTLVPNMELDIYAYLKQGSPTTLPADLTNVPFDIEVESLAIWGVRIEDDFTFGGALTLTSASQAVKIHSQIAPREDFWTKLSGSTIYVVQGSSTAAESLKRAILNNDFKNYDDSQALSAVAALPDGGTARLAGVVVAKPSKALISYMARVAKSEWLNTFNTALTLARLNVVAAGIYSSGEIDMDKLAMAMEKKGAITDLDSGILVLVKSGLPGFIVEPGVKRILSEAEFTEKSLDDLTLYHRSLGNPEAETIPVLVRIEGNRIFVAISGKESYAQTLITGINL